MSEESKPCPFVSYDWCITFEEPCITVRGDSCKAYERIKNRYGSLEKRNEELEAENGRLREALEMLAKFAGELEKKYYPTPPSAKFDTIKYHAEKALKGA